MKSFFCWDRIAKIGKQKVVKSSYYWLVIVPILSKVLHGIETPFEFIFSSGYKLELNLELPFS
ncbi:MAG: hypothetical protein ACI9RM_002909 [Ulvibacter sp.]|jgi:hypothetical protein